MANRAVAPLTWLVLSPRRRRRVVWVAVAAALALAFVVLVAALPGPKRRPPERLTPGRPQTPSAQRPVLLTRGDRRAIDATLDRFVPAAVDRRNPLAAYPLATPTLRSGATRDQWARGDIPVAAYPVSGARFHDWTLNYAVEDEANIDLSLRPRPGSGLAPALFTLDLKRVRGRWLVDSMVETAEFSAPPPPGPATASGRTRRGPAPQSDSGKWKAPVSRLWLAVPVVLVGGALAIPLTVFAFGAWRARRRR